MEIKDNMEHLSSSQEATWPSSTNSFTAWGTPHAKMIKWFGLRGQPEWNGSALLGASLAGMEEIVFNYIITLWEKKQ